MGGGARLTDRVGPRADRKVSAGAGSHRRPLLFPDATEARALWRFLAAAFPELLGMCLMPDHAHILLPHGEPTGRLSVVESAYARWRNHHREETGPVFAPRPPVEEIPAKWQRRVLRYVLLNPCRAGLVRDPLSWPWSTHRDRVGLTATPLGPVEPDPADFQRYVSSDPTVAVGGTPLPRTPLGCRWRDVADAAVAATRCDPADLGRRGPARTLAIRAAWHLGLRDVAALVGATGISRAQLYAIAATVPERGAPLDGALEACVSIVADGRFRLGGP